MKKCTRKAQGMSVTKEFTHLGFLGIHKGLKHGCWDVILLQNALRGCGCGCGCG
jgi:hypothetical protein